MSKILNKPVSAEQTLSSFGGYNASHFKLPGQWENMLNVSDEYAPFIAPRRGRERALRLADCSGVDDIMRKNGVIIYSSSGSIFLEEQAEPVFTAGESTKFHFVPMGERVLCIAENGACSGYLVFEKNGSETTACFKQFLNYEAKCSALDSGGNFFSPKFYRLCSDSELNYRGFIYNSEGNLVAIGNSFVNGGYDNMSENFLNIAFKFCVEEDDGSLSVLRLAHICTPEEIASMKKSQYYIGPDKKLYRFDAESGAKIEIETPKIAMFLRTGLEPDMSKTPVPQESEEGDIVSLEIGRPLNLSLAYSWVKREEGCEYNHNSGFKGNLRVLRFEEYGESSSSIWHSVYGMDCCFIFDYDALFQKWLISNNLIHDSEHYARTVDVGSTTVFDNFRFENTDSDMITPVCDDFHFYPAGTQKYYPESIKISTVIPDFGTGAVEHNNRIWCADNSFGEIRSSALGNFKNWCDFSGLHSDSFSASVGTDGEFNACFVIDEYVYFFKENSYSVLFGTRPANFGINTVSDIVGIGKSGAKGVQVIGRRAFYPGVDGRIYAFNGSAAVPISAALGDKRYTCLSSAHSGTKYYLLLERQGKKQIFIYCLNSGEWYIEDAEDIDRLLTFAGRPCAVGTFKALGSGSEPVFNTDVLFLEQWSTDVERQGEVRWFLESPAIGEEDEFYHSIKSLSVSFESEKDAFVEFFIKYDEGEDYVPVKKFTAERRLTSSFKAPLRRCRCFRLKIVGRGLTMIKKISWRTEKGSEK